ncbi:hypothetical protein J3E72DRAFT_285417 [Bipolaris maydis]|uniref:uncharacterized protein n=1 Tax=Cochliobolus heterostrophus TaxID=5016 RepID=UPI0024D8643E|nr:hypothetical protein J3E73DRAFT_263703 [Bipolaris maydis]KAJ5052725.1 hypothetical protein J3E74DRAFT_385171 [Bipolaris maydis]KAJ6201256.1 hypothetical protein J3E72DRAFT_285417 [Bipolaris maydis]KAJ6211737.1 hypothetical protein PSV09DRAFT_2299083 [Bipolaris maydis]KAJ6274093.1 hypothetical protein PSV08DRAFT_279586 [Bipolaris maydis]
MYYIKGCLGRNCFLLIVGRLVLPTYFLETLCLRLADGTSQRFSPTASSSFSFILIFVLYSSPSAVGIVFPKARILSSSRITVSTIVFCSTLPYFRCLLDICSPSLATGLFSPPHPFNIIGPGHILFVQG